MNSRTYYDYSSCFGKLHYRKSQVQKMFAKKYITPDANMNQGIDTTCGMQEDWRRTGTFPILESRHEYDKELGGGQNP